MSILRKTAIELACPELPQDAPVPPLEQQLNIQQPDGTGLKAPDLLRPGYGYSQSSYPYFQQNRYDRVLAKQMLQSVELENDVLKAVFLPGLGGRLWSLFDKKQGTDLLHNTSTVYFSNLASRDAWFAGGVEWNCGPVGHHPHTCETLFTATGVFDDGTPYLRFYTFERIRALVYQLDCWLPDGRAELHVRIRLVNTREVTVPAYWWSNIAVPASPEMRVLTDADAAYTNKDQQVLHVAFPDPDGSGSDYSYPDRIPSAVDYFFRPQSAADPSVLPWLCQVNEAGYGLMHLATPMLKGRKLFVWGQGQGSRHWQTFLGGEEKPFYNEIQAGLALTQYESVPMPGDAVWEWLEVFSPVQLDPAAAHADWSDSRLQGRKAACSIYAKADLERELLATEAMAVSPAERLISGNAWGQLDIALRGGNPRLDHLDFTSTDDSAAAYHSLLNSNSTGWHDPDQPPDAAMTDEAWLPLLQAACGPDGRDKFNWYSWHQLALLHWGNRRWSAARQAWEQSTVISDNAWAHHGLAMLARERGDLPGTLRELRAALQLNGLPDIRLLYYDVLLEHGDPGNVISDYRQLPEREQAVPRLRAAAIAALIRLGETEAARSLLEKDGGLVIPNIREGENSLSSLWISLRAAEIRRSGAEADMDELRTAVPEQYDFRMQL